MSEIYNALGISAHGMKAQSERVRVISENIANVDTAPENPDDVPYRRQIVTFKNSLDREMGITVVDVADIKADTSKDFLQKYMPDHPAADEMGYVKMPNVNMLVELMDMREAQRSYEANLGMIEQSKTMLQKTIDLLRG